jgi:hypothetical protein
MIAGISRTDVSKTGMHVKSRIRKLNTALQKQKSTMAP